jgi:hypothetical protein
MRGVLCQAERSLGVGQCRPCGHQRGGCHGECLRAGVSVLLLRSLLRGRAAHHCGCWASLSVCGLITVSCLSSLPRDASTAEGTSMEPPPTALQPRYG